MQLFLSLMRTRRLAATGQALGCDTSTASRRLARLEATLDTALFDRTREGLVPTAAALRLLGAAEEMERASHTFRRELDGLEREVEGAVKLSVPPGRGGELRGAACWARCSARHPQLRFEVDASVRQADLTRREADLAIRTIRPSGGPLVRQLLTRAQWVPMATPELVASLGALKDWSDVPWVGWGFGLEQLHAARWLAQAGAVPRRCCVPTASCCRSAWCSRGWARRWCRRPTRRCTGSSRCGSPEGSPADAKSLPVDELWLVTHEALRHVPRVAAVWDFIAQAIS